LSIHAFSPGDLANIVVSPAAAKSNAAQDEARGLCQDMPRCSDSMVTDGNLATGHFEKLCIGKTTGKDSPSLAKRFEEFVSFFKTMRSQQQDSQSSRCTLVSSLCTRMHNLHQVQTASRRIVISRA
jgi:hypothetical protein